MSAVAEPVHRMLTFRAMLSEAGPTSHARWHAGEQRAAPFCERRCRFRLVGLFRPRRTFPGVPGDPAQLRDPSNTRDSHHDAAAHCGDQQRHAERNCSGQAKKRDLDVRRVLKDEDYEEDQQQEGDAGGHPGGAGSSQPRAGCLVTRLGGCCFRGSFVGSR